jgi:C-terminal processing protease CtpA/Prc
MLLWSLVAGLPDARAQSLSLDRERGRTMLNAIKNDLKKSYYDPTFRGIDLDSRFKLAEEKIREATSVGQVFGVIAQALLELEDSHTFFIPPSRSSRTDYGWQVQMIGNQCHVVAVKPGSDAEAKGLKPGDEIYSVDGSELTRENLWKFQYVYYTLRPRPGMRVVVKRQDKLEQLDVMAKIKQGKRVMDLASNDIWDIVRDAENEDRLSRHQYYEIGEELFIWKMPQFDLENSGVDSMMAKVKKRKALILDLRGNSGGYEITLQRMLGHFFEQDLKVGDIKGRKETKPLIAKTRGDDRIFKGKVVVLVDSKSASSAEMFARMMQLEKRGFVIGDQTSGAVMRAIHEPHQLGADTIVPYGVSVTVADLIMADGKSLERVGVTPDETLLPTGADLTARRDPVLARAAELVGIKLDSEKAGALFPIEWRK